MVQGPSAAALEALRDASASVDQQIAILRQLKNDIAGHQQRKELVVRHGAVETLVRAVKDDSSTSPPDSHSDDDGEVRLQATLVLGSLAGGGPTFLRPLLAAGAPESLLASLVSYQPNRKQVLASLRALRSLALQTQSNIRTDSSLRANIIDHRSLAVFESILHQREYRSSQWNQLVRLVLDIITAAAEDEDTRRTLSESPVFNELADTYVDLTTQPDLAFGDAYGQRAPSKECAAVTAALAAILRGSNYRAELLVARRIEMKHASPTPLPALPVPPLKSVSFNGGSAAFPALGSLQPQEREHSSIPVAPKARYATASHNSVCMFLLAVARDSRSLACAAALRLLAAVNHAVHAHTHLTAQSAELQSMNRLRERYMALCAVPLAIRLIQTSCEKSAADETSVTEEMEHRQLKAEACDVLADLIRDSKDLQVAAVDGGAIKRICSILKKSFDNIVSTKPMWSSRAQPVDIDAPLACRLGERGLPSEMEYAMRCRRGALEAIAALASKEDIHRQAIVQAGVVSCIIDSLKPFTPEAWATMHIVMPRDGNTVEVIIAACHAAQSMSRSVSLLRTSLIDAGIAKPIFDLLKHPLLEVQVAATDVCCNLVLEFSPMREELLRSGVIKTLTEHARQSEMSLRLSSLWALKHLVLSASRDIKVQTLEELGTGWLVAAVQGRQRREDAHDAAIGGVSINSGSLSAPNAAGERVDLLNPSSMDVDPPAHQSDEDREDGEVDEASLTHYQRLIRSDVRAATQGYLESARDLEQNSALRAKRDDVAVQEQGLDFIRNMLNGDDCAYMLEHLLNQVGTTKLFSILTEKLAPLSGAQQHTSSRAPPQHSNSASRSVYAPTELILSTIHCLTHIANGSPQHKQLLIAQRPLLLAWLPHFHHPDRRVRCVSVWAVNSLTWIEDEQDRGAAVQRVRALREMGIVGAVEGLRGDSDLDVRERVRVAGRQIEGLA